MGNGDMGFRGHGSVRSPIYKQHQHTFRVRHGDMGFRRHWGEWGTGTWGLGDMVPLDHLFLNNTYTPLGLDRGTWGLGDMGGRWGHGVMGSRTHGSTRSPMTNTNTPLGLDRGTWGLGDMGRRWGDGDMGSRGHGSIRSPMTNTRDMGSRGHGSVRSPIYKQHQHTFRVRHGDMGFRRHGSTRSPKSNTNTHLGFGCLLCHSTQLHHQSKLVSSSNIQNNVLAKMNRHLQCGEQQVSCSKITKYHACHEKVIVMIDPCHIWNVRWRTAIAPPSVSGHHIILHAC